MTSEQQKTIGLIHPVDWAMNFAWAKKFTLIYLSLPCLLIEIISSYIGYYYPLTNKQTLLITLINALPTSWLIGAIVLLTIQTCRDLPLQLETIALNALGFLPKVFFSYAAIFLIILFAFTNPLFVIFVPFFVWAPAFAICDIFAPPITATENEDLEIDYDDDFIGKPKKTSLFFTAPWNIGLIRSINLASRDVVPTLLVCCFFWFAIVVPVAITYLIIGQKISTVFIIVQHLLTTFTVAIALGIWAALFVIILPQQAKEDLKIPSTINLWNKAKEKKLFFFYGKFIPITLMLILGIGATVYLFEQTIIAKDIPDHTTILVNDAHIDDEQLVLRIVIEDKKDNMRWLSPGQFQVALENPDNKLELPAQSRVFKVFSPPISGVIAPIREAIVAYDTKENEISIDSISPRSEPIELVLRYQLQTTEDKGKGFLLYYRNIVTGSHKGPLFRGIPKQ